MQNYYNRQLEFDNYERQDFLNYLKKTGRINSPFQYASNYNDDILTDKIGHEYKVIRTPQTYFSRKYQGTLHPIDNMNNYYDYYSLGKKGIPYGDYSPQSFQQKIYSPSTFRSKNYINSEKYKDNNNQLNSNNYNNDYNQIKENNNGLNNQNNNQISGNYSQLHYNNSLNQNQNDKSENNVVNKKTNDYNTNPQTNNSIYSINNNENKGLNISNNYNNEENKKISVSKSMSYLDFQDYKRKIEEREKRLMGRYEDYYKPQIKQQSRFKLDSNYQNKNDKYSQNYPLYEYKYPKNVETEYYIDYTNFARYPKNIKYLKEKENPCNIYFI